MDWKFTFLFVWNYCFYLKLKFYKYKTVNFSGILVHRTKCLFTVPSYLLNFLGSFLKSDTANLKKSPYKMILGVKNWKLMIKCRMGIIVEAILSYIDMLIKKNLQKMLSEVLFQKLKYAHLAFKLTVFLAQNSIW